jgi:xanthine/CO dehydrogenase XdhC/CoxF family maturation factor
VKHWHETSQILARAALLADAGRQAALATVVRIQGSAYRRPGAKMLVADDGAVTGGVSGGCLEADVRENGLAVLHSGVPRLLHYDTGDDDGTVWGLGLGCNGAVDIFVQPATTALARALGARLRTLLDGEAPFAVATAVAAPAERAADVLGRSVVVAPDDGPAGSTGDAAVDRWVATNAAELLAAGESVLHAAASLQVFVEVLTPPPRLLVFGAGDDAMPLARYARDAGFRVTVVDHRPAYLAPERFVEGILLRQARAEQGLADLPLGRDTYAVVKTHALHHDREWVRCLIESPVAYVGILGPRARTEEILSQLGVPAEPAEPAGGGRVFGPVGLDLGADGPEQIAVSIVAEVLALRAGREPRHLRDTEGAIHVGQHLG